MEAKRGAISCVFVIVLITIQTEAVAVTVGEGSSSASAVASRAQRGIYEARKRRNWHKFLQYLENQKPPLTLERCSGVHVVEFLKYLDKFSRTTVHVSDCPHYGNPKPYALCACPIKPAVITLYTMIRILRAGYREWGGRPESNPFDAPSVKIYLRQVKECQEKARGKPGFQKKRRKRPTLGEVGASSEGAGSERAADIFFI